MYNKVNDRETEKKENNVARPFFSLSFIVMLVFLSIAYAYLVISIDKKENTPKGVSPGSDENPPIVSNSNVEPDSNVPPKSNSNKKSNKPSNSNSNSNSNKPNPPTPIERPDWKIIFDNVVMGDGSVEAESGPTIDSIKTTITYEVVLEEPGKYFMFDADIVNKGGIDAKIYDIINNGLSDSQKKYMEYTIKYKNGDEIKKDDTLLAGQRKTITIWLKYKDDLEKEDLPDEDEVLKLKYQIVYVEK